MLVNSMYRHEKKMVRVLAKAAASRIIACVLRACHFLKQQSWSKKRCVYVGVYVCMEMCVYVCVCVCVCVCVLVISPTLPGFFYSLFFFICFFLSFWSFCKDFLFWSIIDSLFLMTLLRSIREWVVGWPILPKACATVCMYLHACIYKFVCVSCHDGCH